MRYMGKPVELENLFIVEGEAQTQRDKYTMFLSQAISSESLDVSTQLGVTVDSRTSWMGV